MYLPPIIRLTSYDEYVAIAYVLLFPERFFGQAYILEATDSQLSSCNAGLTSYRA